MQIESIMKAISKVEINNFSRKQVLNLYIYIYKKKDWVLIFFFQ